MLLGYGFERQVCDVKCWSVIEDEKLVVVVLVVFLAYLYKTRKKSSVRGSLLLPLPMLGSYKSEGKEGHGGCVEEGSKED